MKAGLRQGCPSLRTLWTSTFLVVILLVCSSLSHSVSGQLGKAIGSYSGFSLFVIEGEKKASSYKIASRQIHIELARNEHLVKIENINDDDQLELWVTRYEGDETDLLLYQIDISDDGTNQKKSVVMRPIFSRETNAQKPLVIINLKDLDSDRKLEVLVNMKTHPVYGSLYESGNVVWTDIYKLMPKARLANSEFKRFYQEKRREIAKEIDLLEVKLRQLKESSGETDALRALHIEEAKDQIRVYESWLKAITKGDVLK